MADVPNMHNGDLVRATNGDSIVQGRYANGWLANTSRQVDTLFKNGFTFEVLEHAEPPLPTEPGVYIAGSDVLGYPLAYTLDKNGIWHYGAEFRTADEQARNSGGTKLKRIVTINPF